MSRVTLDLPDSLYRQLEAQAQREGVLLDQYLVYALTRRLTVAYAVRAVPEAAVAEQRTQYAALLQSLGQASYEEIEKTLAEREVIEPELGLTAEVVARLQARLADAKQ